MAGSERPPDGALEVVLLDIEGTTTPLAFVQDVLFPYARARVRAFLEEAAGTDDEVRGIVDALRQDRRDSCFERQADTSPPDADVVAYILWLMDRDSKSGPLKALQGRIWEQGYASGALKGEVYPDVRDAFIRWTDSGLRLAIYSSGSVLAQKLLFAHSTAGDLTTFLSAYFDTGVGPKREAASYRRIAGALGVAPSRALFLSDVVAELDAAREAGLRTRLCVRPPATPPPASEYAVVTSFDSIEP